MKPWQGIVSKEVASPLQGSSTAIGFKTSAAEKTLAHYGVNPKTVSLSDSYGFSRILSHLKELPQFEALQVVLLRSMALAVYQTRNGGHFGLAAEFYTHFTSQSDVILT